MLDFCQHYLQPCVTALVVGYLLFDWVRLLYRTRMKQKERPGLLKLNWSFDPIRISKAERETFVQEEENLNLPES